MYTHKRKQSTESSYGSLWAGTQKPPQAREHGLSSCGGQNVHGSIEFVGRVGDAFHLADEMGQHEEAAGGKDDDADHDVEGGAA